MSLRDAPPNHASAPSVGALPAATGDKRRANDGWLDRWVAAVSDLTRLTSTHPMMDAVIDEQVGRRIRIGHHWLSDFASCNYLGLDFDPDVIAAVPEYIARWGTHPSWSRLLGSPKPYVEIEEQMTELLDCEDVLLLATITHIHMSVIPVLAGEGTIFLDSRAHKTIYDGAMLAAGRGATVVRFRHDDHGHLEQLLRDHPGSPRIIAMDGVNSMTGNAPDVAQFQRLAVEYDALLYIDDAHGFGVIGERSPDETSPYGARGNSIVRHLGESYDHVVLVSGFSKSYSSLAAFIACPRELKRLLKTAAPAYLYSGPSPIASLATTLAGLQVNEQRGEAIRAELWRKTAAVLDCLDRLGAHTPNRSGFPIIEVPLARSEDIDAVGRFLFDHGIYVTLAAYPLVPRDEVGFRVQVTGANSDAEIEQLVEVLGKLADGFDLQPATSRKKRAA
jgi:8-amino-7-oxononanoate synthase